MHEVFMSRCFELANLGKGKVAPNPRVGALLVHEGNIIGEGYHKEYGKDHAEVNAIKNVKQENKYLIPISTLYVTLEPCSHFGKTPPCTDLIIQENIREIIIGTIDPNPVVSGNGIKKLEEGGCKVITGILQDQCREQNKRFFTFHTEKRPYIILKWAQTLDGYIGKANEKVQITNALSQKYNHKWRSEEAAIMAGTNTILTDNPKLNVRYWKGKTPVRIALDAKNKIQKEASIFDATIPTIIFTGSETIKQKNIQYVNIDFSNNPEKQILNYLYEQNLQSIIIEGGSKLLNSFISLGLWDEARIFTGNKKLFNGITAPKLTGKLIIEQNIGEDRLSIIKRI